MLWNCGLGYPADLTHLEPITEIESCDHPAGVISMRHWFPRRFATACLLILSIAANVCSVTGQTSTPIVYAISIEGVIDLGLAPFLSRTIREAEEAGAAAVLLEINTFGGRVDAAVVMRDALLNSRVRTIAFVNQRAISAGALSLRSPVTRW